MRLLEYKAFGTAFIGPAVKSFSCQPRFLGPSPSLVARDEWTREAGHSIEPTPFGLRILLRLLASKKAEKAEEGLEFGDRDRCVVSRPRVLRGTSWFGLESNHP